MSAREAGRRFACVLVEHFEAAAHERSEPALRDRPLAVVQGAPPATRVVEANDLARTSGVVPGTTETEARRRCPALVTRALVDECARAARQALLDAALGVSPRVEDGGPGIVHVDLAGLERLMGDASTIARRLVRAVRSVGLVATVGVAGSRTAAHVAARAGGRVTVIPAGDERRWLGSVPLTVLDLRGPLAETFTRWGICTLGDLASLPRDALAVRLGAEGLAAQDRALGLDREPFRPYTPPPFFDEAQGVEWEIVSWEALAPVLAVVLDRLSARLGAAGLCADALEVRLALASGGHDMRTVSLAYPLRQPTPMLTLVALELEARPPSAPVTGVSVSARAVRAEPGQAALWHPPSPAFRDLAATLARLAVLVGRDNVGSPDAFDCHRPDPAVMVPFAPPMAEREPPELPDAAGEASSIAFRRLRPPRPVEVRIEGDRPGWLRMAGEERWRPIAVSVGPWRTEGEWWDERAWARDEWDVVVDGGTLYRLAYDRVARTWALDGAYD
jgi:protein ImuB